MRQQLRKWKFLNNDQFNLIYEKDNFLFYLLIYY